MWARTRVPASKMAAGAGPGPGPLPLLGQGHRAQAHILHLFFEDLFYQTHFENTRYNIFKVAPTEAFQTSMI